MIDAITPTLAKVEPESDKKKDSAAPQKETISGGTLNFSTKLADVDDMIFKKNITNKIPKIKRSEKQASFKK